MVTLQDTNGLKELSLDGLQDVHFEAPHLCEDSNKTIVESQGMEV